MTATNGIPKVMKKTKGVIKMRPRTVQKEKKCDVEIDGLEDFPLEIVGLTPDSIERSGGHIKIPIELLPFLKIMKQPVMTRKMKSNYQNKWLLRVKRRKFKNPRKRR
jgi:hypothetical protein